MGVANGLTCLPYLSGRFETIKKPEWVSDVFNPSRPSEKIAVVGWSRELLSTLTEGIHFGLNAISRKGLDERIELVEKLHAQILNYEVELKKALMLETGRCKVAVQEEWDLCIRFFQNWKPFILDALSSKPLGQHAICYPAAVGSILMSAPMSMPLYALTSAIFTAVAAGNIICVRPSLHTPLSVSLFMTCVHQAGFPPGVVQMFFGDLEVFRRVLTSNRFQTISFVGSEESIERLRRDIASAPETRLVLQSARKNAAYVSESADIAKSVPQIAYAATVDSGQRIESTRVVLVHKKQLEPFVSAFVDHLKAIPIALREDGGNPAQHRLGALCSLTARETYLRFQGIAAREAEETLRWGKAIDNEQDGYFVSPGIHQIAADKVVTSVYAKNAFFGPDVCIVPVDSSRDMMEVMNGIKSCQVLSVYSAFKEEVLSLRELLAIPAVYWNTPSTFVDPFVPGLGQGFAGNAFDFGAHFVHACTYPRTLHLQ